MQYYCFNQSWAKPLSQQGHKLPQIQLTGTSQSETNTCSCLTPHDDSLYSRYCWPPVSLCNSRLLSVLYHLLYLFFKPQYFTKTFEVWLETAGFSISGCMGGGKRDSALFNKQLHVIQSDWNYLIIMLNNNKSVVLFNMYSLFPLSKHIPLCHVHIYMDKAYSY